MKIKFEIEDKTGMAIAHCSGVFNKNDAKKGAESLWKQSDWSGKTAVWDFRDAKFDINSSDVAEVASFVLLNQPEEPPKKMAFVTPEDLEFGMASIFRGYRQDPQTEFMVFRDYDEAIRWAKEL